MKFLQFIALSHSRSSLDMLENTFMLLSLFSRLSQCFCYLANQDCWLQSNFLNLLRKNLTFFGSFLINFSTHFKMINFLSSLFLSFVLHKNVYLKIISKWYLNSVKFPCFRKKIPHIFTIWQYSQKKTIVMQIMVTSEM